MSDEFSLPHWQAMLKAFNEAQGEYLYIDEFEIHERCRVTSCEPFKYCLIRIRLEDYPKAQLKLAYSYEQGVVVDTRFNIVNASDMHHLSQSVKELMLKAISQILRNRQKAIILETETRENISKLIKKLGNEK